MRQRISPSVFLVVALLSATTWAAPIYVENFSFELPGTGKRMGFADIPGWDTDVPAAGSGVELSDATDGDYSAFLMGTDPSIWQLTNHTILRGDIVELRVDADPEEGGVRLTLYYSDDNGARITVATGEVQSNDAQECSLLFNSADAPDSANHPLGIELGNATGSAGDWVHVDNVRLDLIQAGKSDFACQPSPANGATDVSVDVILDWIPGQYANTHNVYFSTSLDGVSSGAALAGDNQQADSYDPGRLQFGETYYWRVDEVNGAPDFTVRHGPVWSFAVEPFARPIEAGAISATASSYATGQGPERTIDRSGMDAEGLHSAVVTDMWLSKTSEPGSAWIQYEFDEPYRLHQMVAWNFNGPSLFTGLGVQNVTVAYSPDGIAWSQMDQVFAKAPGKAGYAYNTVVDFNAVTARFVRLGMNSNWAGGLIKQYGLSEVQFLHIPARARTPNPASGSTEVALDATLSWTAGRQAALHQIYLGTDPSVLTLAGTASTSSYTPADRMLATQYYWRIDEVNQAETPVTWPGELWTFTTADRVGVEDFESYTNDSPNRAFQTWIDGLGFSTDAFFPNGNNGNGSGAIVGHDPAAGNIMERTIVHGGRQSMPLSYSGLSETTRTFEPAQDWTRGGITTLVLFFQGASTNVPGELYVKINGTKVSYGGSASDLAAAEWTQWNIALPASAGLGAVKTLTIGVASGQGMLYIDDIALYRSAPAAEP